MDIQSTIFSGLQDILTVLIGVLVAYAVAFIKQHFSARQIATASWIATDSVNFVAQITKGMGTVQDATKFKHALAKAKELALKAGLNFTDSQWETLLESAYKKAKNETQPLQGIASTIAPYSQDDIIGMIKAQLAKVMPIAESAAAVELDQTAVETTVNPVVEIAAQVDVQAVLAQVSQLIQQVIQPVPTEVTVADPEPAPVDPIQQPA